MVVTRGRGPRCRPTNRCWREGGVRQSPCFLSFLDKKRTKGEAFLTFVASVFKSDDKAGVCRTVGRTAVPPRDCFLLELGKHFREKQ